MGVKERCKRLQVNGLEGIAMGGDDFLYFSFILCFSWNISFADFVRDPERWLAVVKDFGGSLDKAASSRRIPRT